MDSSPMHRRIRSGVTPVEICSASVSWEWVVEAGMDGQAAHIADVSQVAEQLEALDEGTTGVGAAFDPEGQDGPAPVGQIAAPGAGASGLEARPG